MKIALFLFLLAQTFFSADGTVRLEFGYDFSKKPACGETHTKNCFLAFDFYEIEADRSRRLIHSASPPKDADKNVKKFVTVIILPKGLPGTPRSFLCEGVIITESGELLKKRIGSWKMIVKPSDKSRRTT